MGFNENRLIASIFASMMTNFYGNMNNLFTFTIDFDSQLRLSQLYNQNSMLDLSKNLLSLFSRIPTELEVITLSGKLFQLDTMRFEKNIYVNHDERASASLLTLDLSKMMTTGNEIIRFN